MRAIIIGLRIHLKAAVAVPTLLLLSVAVFHAQAAVRTWTGAGVDANWSTVENWQDNLPPNPVGGDSAVFGTNGLGVSVVDQDWILTGLTYNHTNAPNALHIHDLTGNRLTLASGRLQAGMSAILTSSSATVFSGSAMAPPRRKSGWEDFPADRLPTPMLLSTARSKPVIAATFSWVTTT